MKGTLLLADTSFRACLDTWLIVRQLFLILRATPRDSSYFFLIVRNRDFGKKYPPTASLIGYYPNIAIFYSGFLASQRQKMRMPLWSANKIYSNCWRAENIEINFYANGSLNDNLESELQKDSWRCSNASKQKSKQVVAKSLNRCQSTSQPIIYS